MNKQTIDMVEPICTTSQQFTSNAAIFHAVNIICWVFRRNHPTNQPKKSKIPKVESGLVDKNFNTYKILMRVKSVINSKLSNIGEKLQNLQLVQVLTENGRYRYQFLFDKLRPPN